jgi:DNA end-binding protein Ku
MMASTVRAQWKGTLQIGALNVPVALYTASSTSERTSFHMVNRATGHRLRREFVDPTTDLPVAKDAQVKGYEVEPDNFIMIEPEEIEQAVPESNKKLAVAAFVPCSEIDTTFFDKPYYLAPSGPGAEEPYAVVRDALHTGEVAAFAHAVLFRRYRGLMIRPSGKGLIAHTMNFDYEVRSAALAFDQISDIEIKGEMLDLAKHIISTKIGEFDPASFHDRYEAAVAELVRAKMAGRSIRALKPQSGAKVIDLMEALRASAGLSKPKLARPAAKPAAQKKAQPTRKAG